MKKTMLAVLLLLAASLAEPLEYDQQKMSRSLHEMMQDKECSKSLEQRLELTGFGQHCIYSEHDASFLYQLSGISYQGKFDRKTGKTLRPIYAEIEPWVYDTPKRCSMVQPEWGKEYFDEKKYRKYKDEIFDWVANNEILTAIENSNIYRICEHQREEQ